MYFPSACNNILAYRADDSRKFIGADMGMGFVENIFFRTESNKQVKNTLDITPLITPGIKFTITVGASSAFPKTVITLGIDDPFFIQYCKVPATCPDIFSSFHYDGPDA